MTIIETNCGICHRAIDIPEDAIRICALCVSKGEQHPHDLIEKGRKYDELKALIKKVQPEIERSINLTPSGHFRNILTELNIELLQALNPKP